MRIVNQTSTTIYVEETGTIRRGLSFETIKPGETKTIFDTFIQHIYSDLGSSLIVSDNKDESIKIFGGLDVTKDSKEEFGKNAIIIKEKEAH